jgi:hypothetical protein
MINLGAQFSRKAAKSIGLVSLTVLLLPCLLCVSCLGNFDDAAPHESGLINIGSPNWEDDLERKLYAFCISALMKQRGLSASPFAGSTDDWILKSLVPNDDFQKALNHSEVMSSYARTDDAGKAGHLTKRKAGNSVLLLLQRPNSRLPLALSSEQRKRLPGVYLHVEGLLALCRPDFTGLFEDDSKQKEIANMVEIHFKQKVAPLYAALFTLETTDDLPILEVEIRLRSAEIDWLIVNSLTRKEQERLGELLDRTAGLMSVVAGPPSHWSRKAGEAIPDSSPRNP